MYYVYEKGLLYTYRIRYDFILCFRERKSYLHALYLKTMNDDNSKSIFNQNYISNKLFHANNIRFVHQTPQRYHFEMAFSSSYVAFSQYSTERKRKVNYVGLLNHPTTQDKYYSISF